MTISRSDRTSFRIEMKGITEDVVLLIDPPSDGRRLASADIVLWTERTPTPPAVSEGSYGISLPGEYERRGITINGIAATHAPHEEAKMSSLNVFSVFGEGIHLLYLGDTNQTDWNGGALEQVGDVDVLLVPVGGHGTLNAEQAMGAVKAIEPKIVIPILYGEGKSSGYDAVGAFWKRSGAKPTETNKVRIAPRDLVPEGITYYTLTAA